MAYDESLNILLDIDTKGADATLGRMQGVFSSAMGAGKAFLGTIAALEAAIIGVGYAASKKGAEFEALENSLIAVEGSAKRASKAMEELRDIAKGPGLGVTEAIQTFAGLRRGGIDSGLSMSLTREIGNAIAMSGGGREQLGRAGLALGQIAMKGGVQGDELLQLSEAGIPAHRLLKEAFGTADGGELKKRGIDATKALEALTEGLAKLPRVTGGAKNSFENLSDAFDYGMAQMGKGINAGVLPFVNDITKALDDINEGGLLKGFGELLGKQFVDTLETITGGQELQGVIEEVGVGVLAVGYAIQNFSENVKAMSKFIVDYLVPPWGKAAANRLLGVDDGSDPMSLARTEMARMKQGIADKEAAMMIGTMKDGERYVNTGSGWVKQSELTPAQRRAAKDFKSGSGMIEPEAAAMSTTAKQGEVVSILSKIEDNTRTAVERLSDMIMGGGAATERSSSQANIAGWAGGGKGARMLLEAVQVMQGEALISAARSRSFSPQSR